MERIRVPAIAGNGSKSGRAKVAVWVIVAAVLVVFGPLLRGEFVSWDDLGTVAQNPRMNPATWGTVGYYWAHPHMDLYVPVTYTFWAAVAAAARTGAPDPAGIWLNPMVFHAANVLLHVGTALVVFRILRMLVRAEWPAMVGALLFALHPVQVEAVGWVSGAKDLLAGLLAMVAVWQYLEFAAARDRGDRGRWQYAAAGVAYALAVLSKPGAVVTPAVILVIDYWILGRPWRRTVGALWPWGVVAVGGVIVAKVVQPSSETFTTPLWARPLIATDALAVYLGKLVWPARLAIDYGRSPQRVLASGALYWTWVVPAAVGGVCWAMRRRAPWLAAGGLVAVVFLLPVLGLVKFDFQRHSTVADHYLYAAMLGPALVAAFAMSRARGWGAYAVAGAVLAALAAKSVAQTGVWMNSRTLYEHTVAVNPTSLAGNDGLGNMALRAGRLDEAIARARTALAGHPGDPVASYNLANALLLAGDSREAADLYRVALHGRRGPHIYTNLATALARSGRVKEAEGACREGIKMYPDNGQLRLTLGTLLAAQGDAAGAVAAFEEATRLNPQLASAAGEGVAAVRRRQATRPASQPATR